MNTGELSNRLTQIVQGITNTHPIRIKATIEVFLEEFDPSLTLVLDLFLYSYLTPIFKITIHGLILGN